MAARFYLLLWGKKCSPNTSQVIFLQKRITPTHPPLYFNENQVVIKHEQKHLDLILDSGLTFLSHVREKNYQCKKGYRCNLVLIKVCNEGYPESNIYKLYVRPHLDYGDIICHKFNPEFTLEFTRKLEST